MRKIVYASAVIIALSAVFFAVNYELKIGKYDFKGQSVEGNVSMKDFSGQYKIVYFGYVFCPDVCSTTLSAVSQAINELGANNIRTLFFTVDLRRDDIKSCDEFAKYFHKNALCIRIDDEARLRDVAANYGAKYKIEDMNASAAEYSVAHSPFIYLLDQKGRFVKEVTNLTYENIKGEINSLITAH